jgi:hypothetical protein
MTVLAALLDKRLAKIKKPSPRKGNVFVVVKLFS